MKYMKEIIEKEMGTDVILSILAMNPVFLPGSISHSFSRLKQISVYNADNIAGLTWTWVKKMQQTCITNLSIVALFKVPALARKFCSNCNWVKPNRCVCQITIVFIIEMDNTEHPPKWRMHCKHILSLVVCLTLLWSRVSHRILLAI